MPLAPDSYQIPSYLESLSGDEGQRKSYEKLTLARLMELRDAGKAFIEGNTAWSDVDRAYDILSYDTSAKGLSGYATVSINKIRRNFRDLVATVSNLKPSGNAVTRKEKMQKSIWRLNQMKNQWWITCAQDRKYRECCQYACAVGTGYLEPWWDPNFYGTGRGEISTKVRGPGSVYPVMITEDNDLQKAYAVTIVEEVPIHIVVGTYPAYAHLIEPTRSVAGWLGRAWNRLRKPASATNGVLGVLATPQKGMGQGMPVVDVYTTYILDGTVNNTGQDIPMGDAGSSWEYTVPYIGKPIQCGLYDRNGKEILKTADAEDAKLFPLRRRAIWTETCILKDGTSPYLHGRVPLVQMRFDDQPWEFLGISIVRDTWRIQKAINQILRAIIDSVLVRLQPPLKYDENIIDPAAMARINTRLPAQTVKVSMGMGNPIEPLLPVTHWDVPQWIFQVITYLGDELDKQSIVKDLMALAKAKQIPSADSIEKMLESAGPVVQDIARGGEVVTQEFDKLFYPMALQFWDANKVFHVLGEDGALKESIDFDPGNLIPSHLPGEDPNKGASIYSKFERVRWTLEQLSYVIEPFSQAQISRVGRFLQSLQAMKAGLPMGPWTMMKQMGYDVGEPKYNGEVATNMMEEWIMWNEMKADLAKQLQGDQPQQGQGRGRPNSNSKGPSIKSKDGGTRSTVATS